MKELYDKIKKRIYLPENKERYEEAMYPQLSEEGRWLFKKMENARKLLEKYSKNPNDQLIIASCKTIFNEIEEYLDSKGWSK